MGHYAILGIMPLCYIQCIILYNFVGGANGVSMVAKQWRVTKFTASIFSYEFSIVMFLY